MRDHHQASASSLSLRLQDQADIPLDNERLPVPIPVRYKWTPQVSQSIRIRGRWSFLVERINNHIADIVHSHSRKFYILM